MPFDFPAPARSCKTVILPALRRRTRLGTVPPETHAPRRVKSTIRSLPSPKSAVSLPGSVKCPHGGLPDHAIRLKLDRELSETSFEHLIVFVTT